MARGLLVTHGDELNRALGECCQNGDVCMPAQAENVFNLTAFQKIYDMFRDGLAAYCCTIHHAISCP
jgi:hypothetical protein